MQSARHSQKVDIYFYIPYSFSMKLTDDEIYLIRQSFSGILFKLNNDQVLAHLIYDRLFKEAPEAREMFKKNMQSQEEKLTASLVSIVAYLDQTDDLNKKIKSLSKIHAYHNVEARHYELLKKVLVSVFHEHIPLFMSRKTVKAWSKAYDILAADMLGENTLKK